MPDGVETVMLILGMGVIGVPVLLGLLSPLVGAIVVRTLPESAWDGTMLLFAQGGAAVATYLIGALLLDLPWYLALVAALLVGITSYARRAPAPEPWGAEPWLPGATDPDVHIARRAELENMDELAVQDDEATCPTCGKSFPHARYLDQHIAARHT